MRPNSTSTRRRSIFGVQIQGADVGLFYCAGHGVQVRGANYLVPVSANPLREADVDFQLVDTALVLRQMESAGTKLNIVILLQPARGSDRTAAFWWALAMARAAPAAVSRPGASGRPALVPP